jgi:hypothetical protein
MRLIELDQGFERLYFLTLQPVAAALKAVELTENQSVETQERQTLAGFLLNFSELLQAERRGRVGIYLRLLAGLAAASQAVETS